MIADLTVFDAVRRGYAELELSSNEEIITHFSGLSSEATLGHINNIKGILFEQVYIDQLTAEGITATAFEATNFPIVDITIWEDGLAVSELQLKATDSAAYISDTLEAYPDIAIVATSEVASQFTEEAVINSGIENAALEEAVSSTIFEETVSPFGALTILRWFIGIPF